MIAKNLCRPFAPQLPELCHDLFCGHATSLIENIHRGQPASRQQSAICISRFILCTDLTKNISLVATKLTLSLGRSTSAHVIELFIATTAKADFCQRSANPYLMIGENSSKLIELEFSSRRVGYASEVRVL